MICATVKIILNILMRSLFRGGIAERRRNYTPDKKGFKGNKYAK